MGRASRNTTAAAPAARWSRPCSPRPRRPTPARRRIEGSGIVGWVEQRETHLLVRLSVMGSLRSTHPTDDVQIVDSRLLLRIERRRRDQRLGDARPLPATPGLEKAPPPPLVPAPPPPLR